MPRRLFLRLLAAAAPPGDHVPDSELLRRFVSAKDSASFELLVRRHADAVWAAGYRVLRNEADADDAFQVAFLALARKASSIRGTCVGGWLHRVAVNAALRLKASGRREPAVLGDALAQPAHAGRSPEDAELAAVVHQELARLPDRYRLPVVLCDLEGHTHAEAAKVLGWPIGSVSGRLSRAHGILRDRLARRGLAAPAVLLVAATAPPTAVSAAASAASGAAVSPVVLSLTEGVLSAMRIAKLKLTAAVLAATGFVALAGLGTGYALTRVPAPAAPTAAGEQPPPKDAPPAEGDWTAKPGIGPERKLVGTPPSAFPDLKPPTAEDENPAQMLKKLCPRILGDDPPAVVPADDTYRRLLKARLHQGRLYVQTVHKDVEGRNVNSAYFSEYYLCLDDMRAIVLELWGDDPKALIPWLEELVIMSKSVEHSLKHWIERGLRTDNVPPQNLNAVTRRRLEMEAALWKAKHAKPAGGR